MSRGLPGPCASTVSALGGVLSPDSSVSPDSSLETVAGPEERFAAAEPELALASQPLTPAADVALEAKRCLLYHTQTYL